MPRIEQHVGRRSALDFLGVLGVVGDEAAADFGAVRPAHDHGIAARERALDLDDAGRQQAVAAPQRRDRAGIDRERALRLERAGDPFLARRDRIGRRQEPGAAAAVGDRAQRMLDAARRDHHVGAAGGGDLAGLDLGLHAAARQFRAGGARHRLDLRRDALDQRHELARSRRGRGGAS